MTWEFSYVWMLSCNACQGGSVLVLYMRYKSGITHTTRTVINMFMEILLDMATLFFIMHGKFDD